MFKKITLFIIAAFSGALLFAQSPQGLNYQAIARNAQGQPMPDQPIQVKFSILNGSLNGPEVYVENHNATTNSFGLFTLSIGQGTAQSGTFAGIDWPSGTKFLKVEIDNSLQGVTQLLSVPYALYSDRTNLQAGPGISVSDNIISNSGDMNASDDLMIGSEAGGDLTGTLPNPTVSKLQGKNLAVANPAVNQVLQYDGSQWKPSTLPTATTYSAGTGINISGNTISNTGDTDASNDLTNTSTADGDVTGQFSSLSISKLQGKQLVAPSPISNQVLQYDGTQWKPATLTAATLYSAGAGINISGNVVSNTGDTDASNDLTTTSTAGGDLSGPFSNLQIVSGSIGSSEITNGSISAVDLASGVIPTTLPPNGTAAGDLTGTYPNPTVAKLQGRSVASTPPTSGQVLQWNGSSWTPTTPAGGTSGWGLTGNSVASTDFIGTTNSQPLTFKVNGLTAGKIDHIKLNTFLGSEAGKNNGSGTENTAIGGGALYSNSSGNANTAVGRATLWYNTSSNNTAIGNYSLYTNSTGSENTANGYKSLYYNSTGGRNTANGYQALYNNTMGAQNAVNGYEALYSNTTGSFNTADGYQALYKNSIGEYNSAVGYKSLNYNTQGVSNSAMGYYALFNNTTGNYNTSVGVESLYNNTTSNFSTAVGYKALYQSTGSNNIGIGYNATAAVSNGNNSASIGNTSMQLIGGQVSWTATSDARVKTNILANIPGLDFILKLHPITYNFDIHRQNEILGIVESSVWEGKYDIEKTRFSGFLAQEVEEAAKSINYDFSGVNIPKNGKGLYGLRYAEFVVPIVKSIQEQQTQIEALQAENQILRTQIQQQSTDLMTTLKALQAEVAQLKNTSSTVSPERR